MLIRCYFYHQSLQYRISSQTGNHLHHACTKTACQNSLKDSAVSNTAEQLRKKCNRVTEGIQEMDMGKNEEE